MRRYIYMTFLPILALAFCLSSCDDFLDKLPDNRAEIDSYQKVQDLLVSAYSDVDPMMIYEHRTDNVQDNGRTYGDPDIMLSENYYWEDNTGIDWDNPQRLWQQNYKSISAANQALKEFNALGADPDYDYVRGEALIARAYNHFILANTFCQPYAQSTAQSDMGIPYPLVPENKIGANYERGTLKEVYEKIAKDIEEGFPLLIDEKYRVPLYHFNRRAAAAFAARFYLFYGEYELAVKYANLAIDENTPINRLRNFDELDRAVSFPDWHLVYIRANEPANLISFALRSRWGSHYRHSRYSHNTLMTNNATFRSNFPGGKLGAYNLVWSYTGAPSLWLPKYLEIFEITNVIANTGQPHVVYPAFTTDETLLVRAEARVMLKQYDDAAKDLSLYYVSKRGNNVTATNIIDFYTAQETKEAQLINAGTLKPWYAIVQPINPQFTVETGDQERMIQAVLHAKRVENIHSGLRWLDIRRYGIEITHTHDQASSRTLKVGDARRVIQIPLATILEGLPANPR